VGEGGKGGITCGDPTVGEAKIKELPVTSLPFLFVPSAYESKLSTRLKQKRPLSRAILFICGEGGIRTLDTSLSSYNGLANRPFRPLRHLSILSLRSKGLNQKPAANRQLSTTTVNGDAKIKINYKPSAFPAKQNSRSGQ
jgi:hypothetical protein